jgi:phosphatidylinositol alpha-1,6-mannosyltransferase
MKKICFLVNNINPTCGGGRFASKLVTLLTEQGIEVVVLSTKDTGHGEKVILTNNKLLLLLSFFKIRRYLRECDVIHAMDVMPYAFIAALCSIGLRKKFIITAIGSGSIKPLHHFFLKPLSVWTYRRATQISSISSYTDREVKKIIYDLKTEIITLGIDGETFLTSKEGNLIEKPPYIMSVGKVKARKGHHLSIRAFAKVAERYPLLRYVIVGTKGGNYFEELQVLIKELGIEERVVFRGVISDEELAHLYRNAELFILMSQNVDYDVEGFGLVFLEAASFGLPTIGCLDTGAIDAIRDGVNGYLVPQDGVDQAAKKMIELFDQPLLKKKFHDESLRLAKEMTWERTLNLYLELYKNI